MRRFLWIASLGLAAWLSAAVSGMAAAAAAELPPPLPLAELRVGDWAEWEGAMLSRFDILEVEHRMEVIEVAETHVTIDHSWRNLTRDKTPVEDHSVWNQLEDMRVTRRLSLASPPDSYALFTAIFEQWADASGRADEPEENRLEGRFQPVRPMAPIAAAIDAAGEPREAAHYLYAHLDPDDYTFGASDSLGVAGSDLDDFRIWEWRLEGIPFGLGKIEFGAPHDDFVDSLDAGEIGEMRAEAIEAGMTEEQADAYVAESVKLHAMISDPDVPLAELAAWYRDLIEKYQSFGVIEDEDLFESAEDEDELMGMLALMREMMCFITPKIYSLTLSAYGSADNSP